MRLRFEDMLDDLRHAMTGPVGRWRAVRLARGWPGGAVLLVICAAVYLPGTFRIPPIDRDEARFAQASRQMYESVALPDDEKIPALHDGGLVIPKVRTKPRLNKPPLIYWAQTVSAAIFSGGNPAHDAIWMYRLPSAIFAIIAVLATWRLGVRLFDPRVGFTGAVLLAVCPMVVWDAHQARADQLLLACTTVTMWALWETLVRASRPRRSWRDILWPTFFWAALGLGILAKGPITPMIAALTIFTYRFKTRDWNLGRSLRFLTGLAIVAIIVAPWIIGVVRTIGLDAYWGIVSGETIGRSGSAREGHAGPPGYHFILLAPLFWPGVLLTVISVSRAIRRAQGCKVIVASHNNDTGDLEQLKPSIRVRVLAAGRVIFARARGRRAELFCLCWIVPAWIVFELVATKLPHYTLPLYPALALLTARGLLQAATGALGGVDSLLARLSHRIWLVTGAIICAVLPLIVAIPFGDTLTRVVGGVIALVALVLLGHAWRRLAMRQFGGAQMLSVLAIIVTLAGTLGLVLPAADGLWISPRLEELIRAHDPERNQVVASMGYHEDSLVFLTRGRLEKINDAQAWLDENTQGILIVNTAKVDVEELSGPALTELGRVHGYNYSHGKLTDLVVYHVGP